MNSHARQAALRIQLLIEEFSADELIEAISFLGGQKGEDLFSFLKSKSAKRSSKAISGSREGPAQKLATEPRVLREIKDIEPAKYQVLSEFNARAAQGRFLRTLSDFRIFGKVVGKEFAPGKSRKEALNRLLALLVKMDLASIQAAIARLPETDVDDESAFQKLADHIITGGQSRVPENRRAI